MRKSCVIEKGDKEPVVTNDDNMFIIPQENYQTISIENYVNLYKSIKLGDGGDVSTSRQLNTLQKEGCQVFFVDETTSLLYVVLDFQYKGEDSSDVSLSSKGEPETAGKHIFFVLLDFYDSFLDKVQYFQSLIPNDKIKLVVINMPGQFCAQFNPHKQHLSLNNSYFATCLDLLLYHLNERGVISCIDRLGTFGLIGFGNGANIALQFAQIMLNDTTSMFKHLVLVNPITSPRDMAQVLDSAKSNPNALLLDHMLHAGNVTDSSWQWLIADGERKYVIDGIVANVPLEGKLELMKEPLPQLGSTLDVRVLYSTGNHIAPFKAVEQLLESTYNPGCGRHSLARLTTIDGGHDCLHDNPEAVRTYLHGVFDQVIKEESDVGDSVQFSSSSSDEGWREEGTNPLATFSNLPRLGIS